MDLLRHRPDLSTASQLSRSPSQRFCGLHRQRIRHRYRFVGRRRRSGGRHWRQDVDGRFRPEEWRYLQPSCSGPDRAHRQTSPSLYHVRCREPREFANGSAHNHRCRFATNCPNHSARINPRKPPRDRASQEAAPLRGRRSAANGDDWERRHHLRTGMYWPCDRG